MNPLVAGNGDRSFGRLRGIILAGQFISALLVRQQAIQIIFGKAEQREIERRCRQVSQLRPQHLPVPAGAQCELVVGDDQGTALRFAQMPEHDHRHFSKREFAGRNQTLVFGRFSVT